MPSPYVALEERARTARDRCVNEVDQLLTAKEKRGTDLTPEEVAKLDQLNEEIRTLEGDRQMYADLLEGRNARVSVRREPRTYGPDSRESFFRDVLAAAFNDSRGQRAQERLNNHAREQRVEDAAHDRRAHTEMSRLGGSFEVYSHNVETRTEPNITDGSGGYFSPPAWLESPDIVGLTARPARVLAALSTNLPLPQGVQSLSVPRMSVGTASGVQYPTAANVGQDFTDAACVSQVVMFSGMSDLSLQASEQSPGNSLDIAVWRDLSNAIDQAIEVQIINGNGALGLAGQLPGLLSNAVNATTVTFTASASSTTGALAYSTVSQLPGAYANVRKLPPECFVVRTGFWSFVGAGLDSSNRPLDTPSDLPGEGPNGAAPIGTWLHFPVILSEAIATNYGTAANQQVAICARPSDWFLWSGPLRVTADRAVLSGTMGMRLIARRYAAFIPHRLGSASAAILNGTGMIPQTNY